MENYKFKPQKETGPNQIAVELQMPDIDIDILRQHYPEKMQDDVITAYRQISESFLKPDAEKLTKDWADGISELLSVFGCCYKGPNQEQVMVAYRQACESFKLGKARSFDLLTDEKKKDRARYIEKTVIELMRLIFGIT
jgi:hypothetical protein